MGILKERSFYDLVRKNIDKIRDQGEPPRSDLTTFDSMNRYVCDLCKATVDRSGLIQCPLCGRWVCRDMCHNIDDAACMNCHGVIRLLRESNRMKTAERRGSLILEERREALKEERRFRKKKEETERREKIEDMEFRRKMEMAEREKKLEEISGGSRKEEGGGTFLKAIGRIKKMRDTDDTS